MAECLDVCLIMFSNKAAAEPRRLRSAMVDFASKELSAQNDWKVLVRSSVHQPEYGAFKVSENTPYQQGQTPRSHTYILDCRSARDECRNSAGDA